MKVSNFLLSQVFKSINDKTVFNLFFYIIDNYNPDNNFLFNARDFLKYLGKNPSNAGNITKILERITFFKYLKINTTHTQITFKEELKIYLKSNEYGFCIFDISVLNKLNSIYSQKVYLFFEKDRSFGVRSYSIIKLREKLNITGYKTAGEFIRLLNECFKEINDITGNFNFTVLYKKEHKNITGLFIYFDKIATETEHIQLTTATEIIKLTENTNDQEEPEQPKKSVNVVNDLKVYVTSLGCEHRFENTELVVNNKNCVIATKDNKQWMIDNNIPAKIKNKLFILTGEIYNVKIE